LLDRSGTVHVGAVGETRVSLAGQGGGWGCDGEDQGQSGEARGDGKRPPAVSHLSTTLSLERLTTLSACNTRSEALQALCQRAARLLFWRRHAIESRRKGLDSTAGATSGAGSWRGRGTSAPG